MKSTVSKKLDDHCLIMANLIFPGVKGCIKIVRKLFKITSDPINISQNTIETRITETTTQPIRVEFKVKKKSYSSGSLVLV